MYAMVEEKQKKKRLGRPPKGKDKRAERVVAVVTPRVKEALALARGDVPESTYVAQLIERHLRSRAVATAR
jgi:hypothetical protein